VASKGSPWTVGPANEEEEEEEEEEEMREGEEIISHN
jgi:hypothetical protein